ncbi:orexin receptor type 2-like [Actinia tenebrosa]|uniref:Orexin receptor type 2-like n=1 Tax=Actinia tenebrosa TaxID=6105 RepID=A0A6P8IKH5_ACTTE|nr:orexin receptor type 2-like [Actinia tenebrosa]
MAEHEVQVNQTFVNTTRNFTLDSNESLEDKDYVKAGAYILVFLTALIGNTIVVVVVRKNFGGRLRSVSYYFIVSLAVADLIMTVGNLPERITRAFTADKWLLGGEIGIAVCKMANFIEKMTILVSISSLTAIAVDRFFNAFSPHRVIITVKRSYIIISLIWILSSIYCIPILVYGNLLQKENGTYCKTRIFFPKWTLWFLPFLIILLGSLFIVFILYFAICAKLWCTKRPGRQRHASKTQPTARGLVNRKVLKMVTVVVVAFYICFLPYWLGWIFCSYHFTPLICNDTYSSVSILFSYVNAALNPIIYVYFSENFRDGFTALFPNLCRRIRKRNKVNPTRPHVTNALAGITLQSVTLYQQSMLSSV